MRIATRRTIVDRPYRTAISVWLVERARQRFFRTLVPGASGIDGSCAGDYWNRTGAPRRPMAGLLLVAVVLLPAFATAADPAVEHNATRPAECHGEGACRIEIATGTAAPTPFCDVASGRPCSLPLAIAQVAKTNTSSSATIRTITVHGVCRGNPVLIKNLFNLVIQGEAPADTSHNGCSGDKGPAPGSLTSEVSRKPPPFSIPSGSNGEVIRVVSSTRVTIKYLNIRDGRFRPNHVDDGVDYKKPTAGRVFCTCITNNEEGLDSDGGMCNQIEQNLVVANENGIRAGEGVKWVRYRNNTSQGNDLSQTEPASDPAGRHSGLILSESATANVFEGNVAVNDATGNSDDGLKFFGASGNCATGNVVTRFGGLGNDEPPGGDTGACELFQASDNKIFDNVFTGNVTESGAPSNVCRVVSGSGNCGDNIPGAPACRSGCPALFRSESASAPCTVEPIP